MLVPDRAEGLDASLHGETARILDVSPNALSPMHTAAAATGSPAKLDLKSKIADIEAESLAPPASAQA